MLVKEVTGYPLIGHSRLEHSDLFTITIGDTYCDSFGCILSSRILLLSYLEMRILSQQGFLFSIPIFLFSVQRVDTTFQIHFLRFSNVKIVINA